MTFSKDLKPKGEGGTLYTSRDLAAIQAEINALKAATAQLENQLADMADLTNTTVLRANAVQTHDISANLAVFGTAVVEGELAVSNGSGNDKDVIVNRNGVPEWGTPTDINAVNVLVTDTVSRATTVDHTGTVNEADSVQNVDQCETVGEAQTVTQGNTVTHADLVQVADVIQQTGDAQIVGDLDVTGTITQAGLTLDNTYIPQTEKGTANGVATLDNTGRVPASQLTIDAMEYQGKWNADTNTPALADGVGTDGDFYIVSVAGTQDLGGGSISFNVNDSVIYNGARWERIPAGQVDSVNGQTGEVDLTGLDIPESTTDSLPIDRRLKNWLYVDGQGASATKTVRGYYSGSGVTLITFDTDNVYQGAIYLTISGVTAQVVINDNISDSSHYQIPKGTYVFQKSTGSPTYWIIETEYSVTAARLALKADSATTATTATTATSATTASTAAQASAATTAQYSRIANNQYYQSTTAAATQAKTLTETISGTIQIGTSIALRFTNANTASNPYLTIGSSIFNMYIFGERVSNSGNSYKASTIYHAVIYSFSGEPDYSNRGRIDLIPLHKTLAPALDISASIGTSEAGAYTFPRDGFFVPSFATAPDDNENGIIYFKAKRNGSTLAQNGWRYNTHPTHGGQNTLAWVPVIAGDKIWIDYDNNHVSDKALQFYKWTEA